MTGPPVWDLEAKQRGSSAEVELLLGFRQGTEIGNEGNGYLWWKQGKMEGVDAKEIEDTMLVSLRM